MACNNSHMNPNDGEVELSKVFQLLDEILLKKEVDEYLFKGFDSRAYNSGVRDYDVDNNVRKLCSLLSSKSEEDISKMSKQMQGWWQSHRNADKNKSNGWTNLLVEKPPYNINVEFAEIDDKYYINVVEIGIFMNNDTILVKNVANFNFWRKI